AAAPLLPLAGCADAEPPPPSSVRVTPAQAGAGFTTDEPLTRYEDITGYNNFYEFGTGKSDPSRAPKTLRTAPWHVEVSGECERSEEHTSELQSRENLVCRLLLAKKI